MDVDKSCMIDSASRAVQIEVVQDKPALFSLGGTTFGERVLKTLLSLTPIENRQLAEVVNSQVPLTAHSVNERVRNAPWASYHFLVQLSEEGILKRQKFPQSGLSGANVQPDYFTPTKQVSQLNAARFFSSDSARVLNFRNGKQMDLDLFYDRPKVSKEEMCAMQLLLKESSRGVGTAMLKRELFRQGLNDSQPTEVLLRLQSLRLVSYADTRYYLTGNGEGLISMNLLENAS